MGRISRLIVAALLAALLVGACSSKSAPKVDPNLPLTKAAYIKAADATCKTYGDQISGIVGASGGGLTVVESKKVFDTKLIPLFRAELAALRTLKPPKADAHALQNNFLLNLSQGINSIAGDVEKATTIEELDAIAPQGLVNAKAAAKSYGMKTC